MQVHVAPPPFLAGTPLTVVLLAGELSATVLLGMAEGFQPLTFQSKANKALFLASSVSPTESSCDVSVTDVYVPLLFSVSPVPLIAVVGLKRTAVGGSGWHHAHPPAESPEQAPVGRHTVSPTPSLLQGIDEGFAPLTSQHADETSCCSLLET